MAVLLVGLVLFLAVHSIRIVAPEMRDRLRQRLGEGGYKGAYSLVAAAGLVLVVVGYGMARQDPIVIYDPPLALRHGVLLLLLPIFTLLIAAELPGRISAAVKHPMLLAVKLWAFAHLLANGTLADLLLFGGFLAWAVVDRISVKRHPRPAPAASRTARPANDAIAVVGGLILYVATVFWLHEALIGVAPIG